MDVATAEEMIELGRKIGSQLVGGQTIELIGDVGAGKTTITKGIAEALGVNDVVSSPSFTINNNYTGCNDTTLHHYDFYRLTDPGIVAMELSETINNPDAITIVEWANNIQNCLPPNRITIKIDYLPGRGRHVTVSPSSLVT